MENVYDCVMPILNSIINTTYERIEEVKSHEIERAVLLKYCLYKISLITKIEIPIDDSKIVLNEILICPPESLD